MRYQQQSSIYLYSCFRDWFRTTAFSFRRPKKIFLENNWTDFSANSRDFSDSNPISYNVINDVLSFLKKCFVVQLVKFDE